MLPSASTTTWQPTNAPPPLQPDQIHLWRAWLTGSARQVEQLSNYLSAAELSRAKRFVLPQAARRFRLGRGTLRAILAQYLALEPQEIGFDYSANGKPTVAHESNQLVFNVAHCGDLFLVAIAWQGLIGLDVEQQRPLPDMPSMVERFFSPWERAEWQKLPPLQRVAAFTQAWTRKEAFLKAIGAGLQFPLDHFSVTIQPNQPARLVEIEGSTTAAKQWHLQSVPLPPDHHATIATNFEPQTVLFFQWQADLVPEALHQL